MYIQHTIASLELLTNASLSHKKPIRSTNIPQETRCLKLFNCYHESKNKANKRSAVRVVKYMISHALHISDMNLLPMRYCTKLKCNLNATDQTSGWHNQNKLLDFGGYNTTCLPSACKVNPNVSAGLTRWEMQEKSNTSALPLHPTTEDHCVFGDILQDLVIKPVIVTAHSKVLTHTSPAFQHWKHTELTPYVLKSVRDFGLQPDHL